MWGVQRGAIPSAAGFPIGARASLLAHDFPLESLRADFLFLGAALKVYGFQQLLLHSGSGQVIVCGQSIRPVILPDVPQDTAQIVCNEMSEIFFLLYLRRFQGMEVRW